MTIERVKYHPIEGGPSYTYWSRQTLVETFAECDMPFGWERDDERDDEEFREQLKRYRLTETDDGDELLLFDGKPIGRVEDIY